jgi:RimJ/RimL family protein N-acetyltransferase
VRPAVERLMNVRPATKEDLPALAAMGAELARLHHEYDPLRFMYAPEFAAGYESWFATELKRRNVCFRVLDDRAGYVYGRLQGKEWNELLDDHAALIDIYVRPDARRHHAGTALVRAFCAWADEKGAPRVVLSTAAKNLGAQALFAQEGFRPTMIEMTRERG